MDLKRYDTDYGWHEMVESPDGCFYDADEADKVIADLKKEIERCQRYHDAEAVKWLAVTAKTETENRRLKRVLWLARAKNASYNVKNRQRVINTELEQERPDIEFIHHHEKMKQKWMNVERLCRHKAEEYK